MHMENGFRYVNNNKRMKGNKQEQVTNNKKCYTNYLFIKISNI
jgi:hypothetical protein